MDFPVLVGRTLFPLQAGLHSFNRQVSPEAPQHTVFDGPPYANGLPHLGHVLNKHLKDALARALHQDGGCSWRSGSDCHGLPVELCAEKLHPENPQYRSYAQSQVLLQKEVFDSQGWMMDTKNSWTTMDFDFEAHTMNVFRTLLNKGYVYTEDTPVLWCGACGSTLSQAEQENKNFKRVQAVVGFEMDSGEYLLSWTTTCWTLPLHKALVVSPDQDYRALLWQNKTCYVSSDTYDTWLALLSAKPMDVVKRGEHFKGATYTFPWGRGNVYTHKGVLGGAGTGVLHCVPGLSELDTEVGKDLGFLLCYHTLENGTMAPSTPFAGRHFLDKSLPLEVLENFLLFWQSTYETPEPHCWRHMQPLFLRPSRQVYLDVLKAKPVALSYVDKTTFYPPQSKNRLLSFMENREKWCVSRQRQWGVPLALLLDKDGNVHPQANEFMQHAENFVRQHGVEKWHQATHQIPSDAVLVRDVLDVWFDSGCVPLYLNTQGHAVEGTDQHRGWFQSCFWLAAMTEKGTPFLSVTTHGFVVDATGAKYSKSKGGGGLDWQHLHTDVVRLWALGGEVMQDRQWSKASVEQATARYQKLRNTLRFLLANQTPSHDPTLPYALTDYDQYWVNKTKECLRDVQTYLKESQFHLAVERAHSWSETLSSVCFNAAKDRLYCAKENSPERWGLEKALHMLLGLWLEVLELLCPRTKDESLSFVTVNTDFSEELFCSEDMTTLLDWRENHGPSLEAQSVPRHLLCVYTPLFKWSERATADALGVGEVRYTTRPQAPTISTHPLCPRCRRPGMMLENWCTTCEARRKS